MSLWWLSSCEALSVYWVDTVAAVGLTGSELEAHTADLSTYFRLVLLDMICKRYSITLQLCFEFPLQLVRTVGKQASPASEMPHLFLLPL